MDDRGAVVASAEHRHETLRPREGWSEQDPETWWQATVHAIRAALGGVDSDRGRIECIGLSGQMHGSVFLPAGADSPQVRALRPALLWNDQRTTIQCKAILDAAGGEERLLRATGNTALTGLTAPKILWLRDHEPESFKRLGVVINPKDFVRFRLTGDLATDVGDASGFGLFDPECRQWNQGLLNALQLDQTILPRVVNSHEIIGVVSEWAGKATGLEPGIPVVAGSGDQMTGAIGTGIVRPGRVSATLGTSGVVFAHLGTTLPDSMPATLQTMCSAIEGEWCTYGCTLSAAGAMEWYREAFCPTMSFRDLDEEAAAIDGGANGLTFLPYLSGERCPVSDPRARAAFIGLSARHRRPHLTRAVLEGVAFTMAAILDLVRAMGVSTEEVRLIGGGAKSDLWSSILSAAFECPVARPDSTEGSALGAAILAGVGVGLWSSVPEACDSCIRISETVAVDEDLRARYRSVRPVYEGLYRQLKDAMHALSELT